MPRTRRARVAALASVIALCSCGVKATSVTAPTKSGSAVVTVVDASEPCGAAPGQLFPPGAPWNTPIDSAPLDAASSQIVSFLSANQGSNGRFQITFDFNILRADATVTRRAFTKTGDFYTPDCDPAPIPVPPGGRLEGEASYACSGNGDCHLTVIDRSTCRLYELFRADISDGRSSGAPFTGGCLAIWDLSKVPPATGRGDFCTSADAGGLPILPMVFTPDEVAAGSIEHALRFALPNSLIRHDIFVRPGTHSTGATSGGASAPPYAVRMRLKASKDISGLTAGAQVIARALKKYGMILADGGKITFMATTDDLTAHTWASVGVDSHSLMKLAWTDFEVVDLGTRFDWSKGDCARTPIQN
jgi:serine/threonine-protein kinase